MARRIAVTPGTGDSIGVVDTDADDSAGSTISAQLSAIINEKGEIIDLTAVLGKAFGAQQEIIELLFEINETLKHMLEKE